VLKENVPFLNSYGSVLEPDMKVSTVAAELLPPKQPDMEVLREVIASVRTAYFVVTDKDFGLSRSTCM